MSVLSVSDPASYGVGEGPSVAVNGRTATATTTGLFSSLSWTTDAGELVVVRSVRLDDDQLLAFASGLVERTDRPGWDASALPGGLAPGPEETPEARDRYHSAEATFTRGNDSLDLSMDEGSALGLEDLVEDRVGSADELGQVEVLGEPAALTHYEEGQRYSAMWFADGVVYELDGVAGDRGGFLAALGNLRPVDRGTWEAALPEGAVVPSERATVVGEMLRGVPLPPEFDVERLRADAETKDRYQLGARVAGGVACAWIDRWATARDTGDTATADEAVAAVRSSREWPILQEMNAEGDYPEFLWETGDEMAGGEPVEEDAAESLGCPLP